MLFKAVAGTLEVESVVVLVCEVLSPERHREVWSLVSHTCIQLAVSVLTGAVVLCPIDLSGSAARSSNAEAVIANKPRIGCIQIQIIRRHIRHVVAGIVIALTVFIRQKCSVRIAIVARQRHVAVWQPACREFCATTLASARIDHHTP